MKEASSTESVALFAACFVGEEGTGHHFCYLWTPVVLSFFCYLLCHPSLSLKMLTLHEGNDSSPINKNGDTKVSMEEVYTGCFLSPTLTFLSMVPYVSRHECLVNHIMIVNLCFSNHSLVRIQLT